jgi:hypothetical protein
VPSALKACESLSYTFIVYPPWKVLPVKKSHVKKHQDSAVVQASS